MQKKSRDKKNFIKISTKIERTPGINIDDFTRSCEDLIGLCDIIKDQNQTNQSLLKNFIKIRLVGIVEFNLKGFISSLIDDQDLDPKEILAEDSITIDLDVLQRFKLDEYTKGKIVVAHLDNMNPGNVYTIMSKINQVDSFKWFDHLSNMPKNTFWSQLKNLYKERNDLVHNLVNTDDSVETLRMKIDIMSDFVLALYIFTNVNLGIFNDNLPESVIMRDHGIALKKRNLTYGKFKNITTKFRKEYRPPTRRY